MEECAFVVCTKGATSVAAAPFVVGALAMRTPFAMARTLAVSPYPEPSLANIHPGPYDCLRSPQTLPHRGRPAAGFRLVQFAQRYAWKLRTLSMIFSSSTNTSIYICIDVSVSCKFNTDAFTLESGGARLPDMPLIRITVLSAEICRIITALCLKTSTQTASIHK